MEWLLIHDQFEKALKYVEANARKLRRHTLYQVGRQYMEKLIEMGKFEELGPIYRRVFKLEKRLWEEEVSRLIRLNHADAIAAFVPLGPEFNQIKLESHIYEAILISLMTLEPRKDQLFLGM